MGLGRETLLDAVANSVNQYDILEYGLEMHSNVSKVCVHLAIPL